MHFELKIAGAFPFNGCKKSVPRNQTMHFQFWLPSLYTLCCLQILPSLYQIWFTGFSISPVKSNVVQGKGKSNPETKQLV